MKTVHGSFAIERNYRAPPARVFAAWADVETKAKWFIGPPGKWKLRRRELDFRPGGREVVEGEFRGGQETLFDARYHVIEPGERLVYAYDMHHAGIYLSVSLATVDFAPAGGGTRMLFIEQIAFVDGEDGTQSRKTGTDAHFELLAGVLER